MQTFASWYKQLQKLPRWAQSLVGLGIIFLFVLIALIGTGADQTGASGSSAVSTFWTMMGIFWKLGLVLLIAYFSLYFLRRWQGNGLAGTKKQLSVLESHHLSPRQAVYLIRVGEQTFLIGATDQSISMISEVTLPDDEQPASVELPEQSASSFVDTLANARHNQENRL